MLNLRDTGTADNGFWTLKNKYEAKYENRPSEIIEPERANYNNYVITVMEEDGFTLTRNMTFLSNSIFNEFEKINKKTFNLLSSTHKAKFYGGAKSS